MDVRQRIELVRTMRLVGVLAIALNAFVFAVDLTLGSVMAFFAAALRDSGLPADSPGAAQLDVTGYLPPQLRPGTGPEGMPQIQQAVTTVQGTDVCPGHVPVPPSGRPAARKGLIVANGALSPAMVEGARLGVLLLPLPVRDRSRCSRGRQRKQG
jgi:hypothetical protein